MASAVYAASQQPPPSTGRDAAPPVDFAADVRPILAASCFACHSGERPMAQLRLDVRSLAMKGGVSGPVIVPGRGADSPLMHRVLGTGGATRMPLGLPALTAEQADVLRRWIDQGAPWPDVLANESNATIERHWAYVPPVRPATPAVQDTAWVRNPIDSFVLARVEREGLQPSHEASRETLIRRVSLDLTGLPPSPADVDAFLADTRPDAYERVVERLLASPHYGERWATPWLDLARYGDSDGYDKDLPRVAWPYRDWVVRAFNQNLPFDRFTIEQLAGDLLPNATTDQKIATGFVRASLHNTEGGTDPEEQNWVAQVDRASTVGTVFLGSTVGCAQCHDHKYDPLLQKDFYGLVAFFNNAAFVPNPRNPKVPSYREATLELPTPQQAVARDAVNAKIREIQAQMDNWPQAAALQGVWERGILDAEASWHSLMPTRVSTTDGSTLAADATGAVLASGRTPDGDTYLVDANAPVAGRITGLRIEALPHPTLPMNGPGRDYYGNFALQTVEIEHGRAGRFAPVATGGTVTDSPSVQTNDTVIRVSLRQLWRVQAGGEEKLPRQFILLPAEPFAVAAGDTLRIRLVQKSDIARQILGHFRLSVTTSTDPGRIVAVPYNLRPALRVAADQRKPDQQQRLRQQWQRAAPELAALRAQIQECAADDDDAAAETGDTPACGTLRRQLADLKIPTTLVLAENPAVTHPTTFLRTRGDFTKKAEEVKAAVPSFLGTLPASVAPNRLGLATWLVGRENPLTARVRMNQIWQVYFGRGLVDTSEDFGSQGSAPSHPDLLDWLAVEFMDRGWDQKAMHRLIVTSSTYRQSSGVSRQVLERDPANVLFTRGPRFRVEGEMVRDIALAASGLLSTKMGGPPVMPYQPDGLWSFHSQKADDRWVLSEGEDRYRRGLYTYIRRTARYPSLTVFDAPSHETAVARRPTTNTPLQALTTLNDPAFFEAAQAMARRIVREGGTDTASRATYGFRLATSLRPDAARLRALVEAFDREAAYFRRNQAEAAAVAGRADPELAAWTLVANTLLNLDQTLTKE
jgi:hypothetical protein